MAWKLKLLLEDLSDLISIKSDSFKLKTSEFNPRITIGRIVEMCNQQAREKSLNLNMHLRNVDTTVFLDQRRFTQVISSVLLNTLYYAHENSVITIEANIKDGDESVSNHSGERHKLNFRSQQPEQSLIVHIIDPSYSISDNERISLFKPIEINQISEESEQNYSKSFYIARLITKKIGGDIVVESTTRGSIISVEMKIDSKKSKPTTHIKALEASHIEM